MTFKYKRLMKVLLIVSLFLLLASLSFSAISAADVNTNSTDTNGIKGAVETAESGDTINLAPGTYKGEKNTNIDVSKSLTIKGQTKNSVNIDGNSGSGRSNLFTVYNKDSTINVNFVNINFINGGGSDFAVLIYNGKVSFTNCTFTNNKQSDFLGQGGAIYNAYGDVTINGCTFNNNSAGLGGAISNSGNMSIINSNFANNFAGCGGAIYNYEGSNMSITGCNITKNKCSWLRWRYL